jgi:tRNA pseudouridine55 synthase
MIRINKKIGETPLAALKQFRGENPEYATARLSYAGRLDPMAEGELLILEGEENDRRADFLGLDKTYKFQILFGISTDTFDLLGLVDEKTSTTDLRLSVNHVQTALDSFAGKWEMAYPPYSAKTVASDGKKEPLWKLARKDKLTKKLPTKSVEIYRLSCSGVKTVDADYIINYIIDYITNVTGDFRQAEITTCWKSVLADAKEDFLLANCRVSCSSGTYVRRLAEETGRRLGVPALAFSITRTEIGT